MLRGEHLLQAAFQAIADVFKLRRGKVTFHGQVNVNRCPRPDQQHEVQRVAPLEDQPFHPSIDAVAKALASRHAIWLQPSGGYAANLLGLSEQVPMKVVFLTDGINRRVQIGKLQILFKRTSPRNLAAAGKTSGLVIQALRHLGRRNIDDLIIQKLQKRLATKDRKQLLAGLRHAPVWVANVMRKIAESQPS